MHGGQCREKPSNGGQSSNVLSARPSFQFYFSQQAEPKPNSTARGGYAIDEHDPNRQQRVKAICPSCTTNITEKCVETALESVSRQRQNPSHSPQRSLSRGGGVLRYEKYGGGGGVRRGSYRLRQRRHHGRRRQRLPMSRRMSLELRLGSCRRLACRLPATMRPPNSAWRTYRRTMICTQTRSLASTHKERKGPPWYDGRGVCVCARARALFFMGKEEKRAAVWMHAWERVISVARKHLYRNENT